LPTVTDTPRLAVSWWPESVAPQYDATSNLFEPEVGSDLFDGSDEIQSFTSAGILLAEHGAGVGDLAARFAKRLAWIPGG
jgi:hypothetical protein